MSLPTILRNGSVLYGPRLILALVLVTGMFLLLQRPTSIHSIAVGSVGGADSSTSKTIPPGGSLEHELDGGNTAGDSLFEYLKGNMPQALRPITRPDMDDKVPGTKSGEKSEGSKDPKGPLMTDKTPVPETPGFEVDMKGQDPKEGKDPLCDHAEELEDIVIIVRAHAHEMASGNVSTLLSTLKCVDHLLFSTVAHTFGEYETIDALKDVTQSVMKERKEFELYRNISEILKATAAPDPEKIKEDAEHNLGKFTMIPTVLEAYKLRPKKKWFFFIEAKTYVSVPNLMQWVGKMNSEQPIFAGAQVLIGEVELPHSGSGILVSAAAIEKLRAQNEIKKATWEGMVSMSCCGDKILSEAFKDSGVRLHRAFPVTQGETPLTLDWSHRHWCKAAVTWHGIEPEQQRVLNNLDRKWYEKYQSSSTALAQANGRPAALKQQPPLRFGTIFKALLLPEIRERQNRTSWDNLASTFTYTDENKGQYAQYSVQACRAACDVRTECLQYAFEPGKCRLGTVVRYGDKVSSGDLQSGWVIKRVELWAKGQDRSCQSEGVGAWELP